MIKGKKINKKEKKKKEQKDKERKNEFFGRMFLSYSILVLISSFKFYLHIYHTIPVSVSFGSLVITSGTSLNIP